MTRSKKVLAILLLLILLSCKNTDYFFNKNGLILNDSVIRIEYYKDSTYLLPVSLKIPDYISTDKHEIEEMIEEINYANCPGPWKGARWDKICIIKPGSIITLNTNGEVIGPEQSSGTFYKLKDKDFVKRHFQE